MGLSYVLQHRITFLTTLFKLLILEIFSQKMLRTLCLVCQIQFRHTTTFTYSNSRQESAFFISLSLCSVCLMVSALLFYLLHFYNKSYLLP
jgi:hypothetical protein